jgi:hypothetical protein
MFASDAVLGKSGYSTVAEAYWAGIPFGYFLRTGFRESQSLSIYLQAYLKGIEFTEKDFEDGQWVDLLRTLVARPHMPRTGPNGAYEVAGLIVN